MKYAFFGTPEFAAIILQKLITAGLPPELVVCNPDRPSGRKKVLTPPPTKLIAQKFGISVAQPEKLERQLFDSGFDFFIVAAYAKILPKEIVDLPRLGTIGVHPSLLPKYRGATPIQSAILNGEQETGTTLFLLDEKVDHGPILRKEKLEIRNDDTYETLLAKLAELSANLLVEALPKFIKGEVKIQSQEENEASYTKKFKTEDGLVNLEKDDPVLTKRKIRALNPEPGVWTIKNDKRIKILDEETIQFEGKKPVKVPSAIDFLKHFNWGQL